MSRDKLFLNGMYSMKSERRNLNAATKPNREPKLSRTHAPADLSPVDWQRGLRRQFGREQAFELENLSSEPFFSEFRVSNPVRNPAIAWRFEAWARRQFLLMPRLCHQRAGYLQAPRIHARPAREKARRQDGVCARLPARIFRAVLAQ